MVLEYGERGVFLGWLYVNNGVKKICFVKCHSYPEEECGVHGNSKQHLVLYNHTQALLHYWQ